MINFGHLGWSKKKCPLCKAKLRWLLRRKMLHCRDDSEHYKVFLDNDGTIRTIQVRLEQFGVSINSNDEGGRTIFLKKTMEDRLEGPYPSYTDVSKTFERILSYKEIMRYAKSWVFT